MISRPVACALLVVLAACGGQTDNREPPAPLRAIEQPLLLRLNWALDTNAAANAAAFRLQPLLIGERLYTIDSAGRIVCVEADSGRRLWHYDSGLLAMAGLGAGDGRLIASSRDGEVALFGLLEDGLEPLWQVEIGSEIRATPLLAGGSAFVRGSDGSLYSLDAADGSEQWKHQRRVPALSLTGNSPPLLAGDRLFVGSDDGRLLALDRDSGEVVWESVVGQARGRSEIERLVDIDGRFTLRDGVLFVTSFQGRRAAVQAVSGELLWAREFSGFQSMAIDGEALYLVDENSDLWAIDRRSGAALWKQDQLHARRITAPALLGQYLVVGDFNGYQHWLDKSDGRISGRIRTGETRVDVQPLVYRDAVLTQDRFGRLTSVSLRQ